MGVQHPLQPGGSLRILSSSGQIVVTAEERDDLDVEPPDRHVEMKDGGRTAQVKPRSAAPAPRRILNQATADTDMWSRRPASPRSAVAWRLAPPARKRLRSGP